MDQSDPYRPPKATPDNGTIDVHGDAEDSSEESDDLSEDCRGNLGLTSSIIRLLAVVACVVALFLVFGIWSTFQLSGGLQFWTPWDQFVVCTRLVFIPCWALLAWMMWKYATCLDRLRKAGVGEVEAAAEQQAKLWLAIGLLAFLILMNMAISLPIAAALS